MVYDELALCRVLSVSTRARGDVAPLKDCTDGRYRLLRSMFALTTHWKEYDSFFESKAQTYKSSSRAIVHLAKALNGMVGDERLLEGWEREGSPMEVAFL